MEPEIQVESAHGDEGYLAPDVVRLGTAETLTAGTFTDHLTADQTSFGIQ